MFGKLGRGGGGGRGPAKRPLSTPSQLHRPGDSGGPRPQIGPSGPVRARPGAPTTPVALPGREQTFSLESGELDLGAIIRLTPDIVKEIKRVEAQGGSAKIKFDANANNSDGNVVEVGGKEFRFTWARERADLCDIYEERRNGDDGDGLLVECGAAWRKLNVQRILDESTKNHVKMRSEEAERMLKSRKTIVLDPTNPSVKNQAKSMAAAAVEGNMRRMGWKQKEMLFKKRKIENSQGAAAVSQSKFVSKSATISNGNSKGIPSPVQSPRQAKPRSLPSNSGIGKTPRGDTNPGAVTPLSNVNKEEIEFFVKEMPNGVSGESMQELNGYEEGNIDPPLDLQSMLITLLSQNPKGMSLKAIEKALGETVPYSVKKIENALRNVATLQALGRYFLKQGRQIDSSTRSSEGGSSPEFSKILAKKAPSVPPKKAVVEMLDLETRSTKNEEASDPSERINIVQDTEDPLDMNEKAKDNSVVRAGSLSDSGSESDSESSSSGSDSESQSRSKAGSGSASSSDSESDVSSSSKEASDVDVDIMTSDDERGVTLQNIDATASRLSPSPRLWRSDNERDDVDINERDQKPNGASAFDLTTSGNIYEKVNSVSDANDLSVVRSGMAFDKLEAKNAENIDSYLQQSQPRPSDHNKVMENQHESPCENFNNDRHKLIGRSFNGEQILMKSGSEQQGNHENVNKLNNKRSSNSEYLDEKSQSAKRIKTSSSVEATFGEGKGGGSSKSSRSLSPERSMQMDQKTMMMNNYQQDGRRDFSSLDENLSEHDTCIVTGNISRAQSSPDFRGPPIFASEQSGQKTTDSSGRKRSAIEKPVKYVESLARGNKQMQAVSIPPESETSAVKTMQVKGKNDNGDFLDKHHIIKAQENGKSTDSYANGKGSILRRELSDLELGEFREPLPNVRREDKMTVERTSSFKKIESGATFPDSNVDISMGKWDGNGVSESKRQSSPSFRGGMNGKFLADDRLDLSRSQSKFMQPHSRQFSKMDITEPETTIHQDKCVQSGGKNGTRTHQVMCAENEVNGPKRSASNKTPKDDCSRGILVGHKNVKESKTAKLNGLKKSKSDQCIDGLVTSNGTDSRKISEFSSEEENAPYKKYKKDELDLKGPIKDLSMYKDYVQEYQEKYSHYCSLNQKLEKIRNDFLKVGDDIELARGRDLEEYYKVVEKLRQMYHQQGERHKEMKRIYISLHEELKNLKQRVKDFATLHSGE